MELRGIWKACWSLACFGQALFNEMSMKRCCKWRKDDKVLLKLKRRIASVWAPLYTWNWLCHLKWVFLVFLFRQIQFVSKLQWLQILWRKLDQVYMCTNCPCFIVFALQKCDSQKSLSPHNILISRRIHKIDNLWILKVFEQIWLIFDFLWKLKLYRPRNN